MEVQTFGIYNHSKGEIHRRHNAGEQRKLLGERLGYTAPSIFAEISLNSVPQHILDSGNRNDAPSAMLLKKIAEEHRGKYNLDKNEQ